ncbi:glycoside hydrolase family 78 protein [Xylariaceae sp. FL0662B]|nr:glycoside hydrolase family 78 protein [Xylariaceae sp. FL0662B]
MFARSLVSVYWAAFQLVVSRQPVQAQTNDTSWHRFVRAPAASIVRPKAILSEHTLGRVVNPDGLITNAYTTVLLRKEDSAPKPALTLDFGQNVVGLLSIDFAGSVNGSAQGFPGLKLYFSETLDFLANRSDFTRSDNAGQFPEDPPQIVPSGTDQIAVKNAPSTWLNQWGCGFGNQVCADGLHGFRYLKIELDALPEDAPYTSPYGEIHINSVSLQWSGYLGTPNTYSGWFDSSDTDLAQWWFDGSYTTEMCTDVFRRNDTETRGAVSQSLLGKWVIHDGVKRDRDPYVGDLAVSALTSYLTHDFHEAARNVMEDVVQHQRIDGWIPPASIRQYELPLFDYPLWWVVCSWDHVFYTGNTSYIESYYPNLLKLLDTYYVSHTDNITSLLIRQSGYGDYAFLPRYGSTAYDNALYVLALKRAAELADYLGRPSDAARWRNRASAVSQAFLENLWDPVARAFFDRKCPGPGPGLGCAAHAQDGNSLAILAGIANATYAQAALDYLAGATARTYGHAFYDGAGESLAPRLGLPDRVYPFVSYFEIAARFETGATASALAQLRSTYAWMSSHDPGATAWEAIGANGTRFEGGFTSLAHAWSTGVTPLLTTYILGVKPVRPGFREWVVSPRPGDLTWASGEVPTPYGPLNVHWEKSGADGLIKLTVVAPANTNGTMVVPAPASASGGAGGDARLLLVDGTLVSSGTVVDGSVAFAVEGGREYTVSYARADNSAQALLY